MAFLQTKDLSKTYPNGVKAVNSLRLEVEEGEVYGLIGPNGAGKTTTIRILMGVLSATAGSVKFDGQDGLDRNRTGYLPEGVNFYRFMTVREYLGWSYGLYGGDKSPDRISKSLEIVELRELGERKLDELSKGQKQRVGIAQAIVHDPDLLILDEPTSGLDPIGKKKILSIIQDLANEGKTILTSSHILPELSQICTSVGIIRKGEMLLQGTMSDLRKKYATAKVEIGLEEPPDSFTDDLSQQDYVRHVEGTDAEGLRFVVSLTEEEAAKKELPKYVLNSGHVMTYYDFNRVTLEDIFMETVESDTE